MKDILNKLIDYKPLDKDEAYKVLIEIGRGQVNHSQIAVFLSIYMMRSITVNELSGFREALLDLCKQIDFGGIQTIDMCGTGGDGKNTFNISTISAFVTAGAGVKVTKHGNYGVSSKCGSSNVMEYLGYRFTNNQDILNRQLEKTNICILHAPLFHPAMKEVAPIRRELGMKTFFNMLGPLVNPCKPTHQSVGVFNLELARLYKYLFENSSTKYSIVHALDGYDECSLTGDLKLITNKTDQVINPEILGFDKVNPTSIYGGESIDEAGKIFIDILSGNYTESQKNVVVANSAIAISTYKEIPLEEAKGLAIESLESRNALNTLKNLLTIN